MAECTAILGLGLMGGSLAGALKTRGAGRVQVYARSAEALNACRERDWADAFFDAPEQAVDGADCVVLAVHLGASHRLIEACRDRLSPSAVVTDVGSAKTAVTERCLKALDGQADFVGSHPICGSEQSGMPKADPMLYDGADVIVTPSASCPREAVDRVKRLWESAGAHSTEMDPKTHDRLLARTSHTPHFASAALAAMIAEQVDDEVRPEVFGSGYFDMTRLAKGSPDMWRDIAADNRLEIAIALDELRNSLDALRDLIVGNEREQLAQFLQQARDAVDRAQRRREDARG